MRRKTQPKSDRVVPEEILERAKLSISEDVLKKPARCTVCGAPTEVVAGAEALCWVCRRLKISAWKDVEQQMPMQE